MSLFDDLDLHDAPDTAPLGPAPGTATLAQAEALLRAHLHALWETPAEARAIPPLMLWGPPGVGKSTVVRETCERAGVGFIDVRLAQREPVDMRGLPVARGDAVEWLTSNEWPRDPASRGIILFDELTSADRTLQVAAYEFILDRRLGKLYRVPDGWYICAAGNRSGDSAASVPLSSALANRFCHVEVEPDVETWLRWAARTGQHPEVVGFLRYRPECFFDMRGDLERGWPSPRSWERVSTALRLYARHGNEDLLRLSVAGLVGTGAATEFMAFRACAAGLPDVLGMLRGQGSVRVPPQADLRYALCALMVHHLWRADHAAERAQLIEGFFRISAALGSDFAAMAMIDALQGRDAAESAQRAEALMLHPRFEAWSAQHGTAFASLQATLP